MHIAMQPPPSYELSESVTPAHASTAARKSQIRNAPRIKLHPVKTTPVTHSTRRQPFRVRIQAPANRDDSLRRQLFPTTTPRKRKACERPAIKVNCGRERTQPFNINIRRDSDGALTSFLRDCISKAEQRIHEFRAAIDANRVTDRLLENALLLRIREKQHDVFFVERLKPNDHENLKLAVLASKETVPDRDHVNASNESFMFVPQPWHAHDMRKSGSPTIDFLIVPYRASITHLRNILQVQSLTTINQALSRLFKQTLTAFQIPDTQEEQENHQPCALEAEDTFSKISPHTTRVNLYVYIDVCSTEQSFAIVRDKVGEFAFLIADVNDGWPVGKGQMHRIPDACVMAERVKLSDILAISGFIPDDYRNTLLESGFDVLLAFSTRKPR